MQSPCSVPALRRLLRCASLCRLRRRTQITIPTRRRITGGALASAAGAAGPWRAVEGAGVAVADTVVQTVCDNTIVDWSIFVAAMYPATGTEMVGSVFLLVLFSLYIELEEISGGKAATVVDRSDSDGGLEVSCAVTACLLSDRTTDVGSFSLILVAAIPPMSMWSNQNIAPSAISITCTTNLCSTLSAADKENHTFSVFCSVAGGHENRHGCWLSTTNEMVVVEPSDAGRYAWPKALTLVPIASENAV